MPGADKGGHVHLTEFLQGRQARGDQIIGGVFFPRQDIIAQEILVDFHDLLQCSAQIAGLFRHAQGFECLRELRDDALRIGVDYPAAAIAVAFKDRHGLTIDFDRLHKRPSVYHMIELDDGRLLCAVCERDPLSADFDDFERKSTILHWIPSFYFL